MVKLVYKVVQHDGGWAYQVDGAYSETFRSHDTARAAAERAAREQRISGEEAAIGYEDASGLWREELVEETTDPKPRLKVEPIDHRARVEELARQRAFRRRTKGIGDPTSIRLPSRKPLRPPRRRMLAASLYSCLSRSGLRASSGSAHRT